MVATAMYSVTMVLWKETYYYYYYYFDPGTQFIGNEKITLCNTKKYIIIVVIVTANPRH